MVEYLATDIDVASWIEIYVLLFFFFFFVCIPATKAVCSVTPGTHCLPEQRVCVVEPLAFILAFMLTG